MKTRCKCGNWFDLVLWASPGGTAVQFTSRTLSSPRFGQVVENCPGCGRRLNVGLALVKGKTGERSNEPA